MRTNQDLHVYYTQIMLVKVPESEVNYINMSLLEMMTLLHAAVKSNWCGNTNLCSKFILSQEVIFFIIAPFLVKTIGLMTLA